MTRKADQKRFIVWMNLTNPQHSRAWERLQKRGNTSYTEAIVEALNQQEDRELIDTLRIEVTQAVHAAVAEAVSPLPVIATVQNVPIADTPDNPMSDESYATAMAFMDGLL